VLFFYLVIPPVSWRMFVSLESFSVGFGILDEEYYFFNYFNNSSLILNPASGLIFEFTSRLIDKVTIKTPYLITARFAALSTTLVAAKQ
jgi:hypothetical protein